MLDDLFEPPPDLASAPREALQVRRVVEPAPQLLLLKKRSREGSFLTSFFAKPNAKGRHGTGVAKNDTPFAPRKPGPIAPLGAIICVKPLEELLLLLQSGCGGREVQRASAERRSLGGDEMRKTPALALSLSFRPRPRPLLICLSLSVYLGPRRPRSLFDSLSLVRSTSPNKKKSEPVPETKREKKNSTLPGGSPSASPRRSSFPSASLRPPLPLLSRPRRSQPPTRRPTTPRPPPPSARARPRASGPWRSATTASTWDAARPAARSARITPAGSVRGPWPPRRWPGTRCGPPAAPGPGSSSSGSAARAGAATRAGPTPARGRSWWS